MIYAKQITFFLAFSIAVIALVSTALSFVAGFSGSTQSIGASHAVSTFSSSSLSINLQSINNSTVVVNGYVSGANYLVWNWGDGQTTIGFFPQTHTYSKTGSYNITVSAYNNESCTPYATSSITVNISKLSTVLPGNKSGVSYPFSVHYSPYQTVPANGTKNLFFSTESSPSGLSFGVYNGSALITVSQNGKTLYNSTLNGGPFNYVVIKGGSSFDYLNLNSVGCVDIQVKSEGKPGALFAYNLYNYSITSATASLIMYPPQFAVNIGPPQTPQNTGMSFLLRAPVYSKPTPLAIWIGEGFSSGTKEWWAQIGFNNWRGNYMTSYAGWGIFSNIFGNPGGTDFNYSLIPGDIYNFTMVLKNSTTWAFLVNGTNIVEGDLTGYFNTTSAVANEGADLGLETLTAATDSVNITNEILIPSMMEFKINGTWTKPTSLRVMAIGENWWNGVAPISNGIALWGIGGNLQNSSIPPGALYFNDSLAPISEVTLYNLSARGNVNSSINKTPSTNKLNYSTNQSKSNKLNYSTNQSKFNNTVNSSHKSPTPGSTNPLAGIATKILSSVGAGVKAIENFFTNLGSLLLKAI